MPASLRMNGLDYALGPGVTIVGRDRRSCDVVIGHDELVSAIHCYVVALPEGRWLLLDARSSNGTFVDGQAVEQAFLEDGHRLLIGATRALVRVRNEHVAPGSVPDLDRGRLRSGTAVMLPDPPRLQVEAARGAFDRMRALQNACIELAGPSPDPERRLARLAELAWALLGPVQVLVHRPVPDAAWHLEASEPESPHRVPRAPWTQSPWPATMGRARDRARIAAELTRIAGASRGARLVRPVVVPARDPTHGTLAAVVEATRGQRRDFSPAEAQLVDDLCLATGVGLATARGGGR